MTSRCNCGKEFFEERSLLQHQKDAHGMDTSEKLRELAELKNEVQESKVSYKKPSLRLKYALIAIAVVVILAVGIFAFQLSATGSVAQEFTEAQTNEFGTLTAGGTQNVRFLETGDSNAKNIIEEFGDYECPFCMRFHLTTFPQLKKDFIDTGKARYVFKDFPLSHAHLNAQKASEAAHCAAEQGKYEEYHDKLYQNSYVGEKWANRPATTIFKRYASELGLDKERFNKCLDGGAKEKEVRANLEEGQRKGVSGTPSFFVNGRLVVGAQPYHVFAQMLNR